MHHRSASPPPMTLGGHMGYFERPRRIVRPGPDTGRSLVPGTKAPGGPAPAASRRELHQPRPGQLLEAVGRLDAGLDEQACRSLAAWVREQYTTSYGPVPLG